MSRIATFLLCSVLVSPVLSRSASAQQAQCAEDRVHAQNFWYDYYRNKAWPMPFRAVDTQSVVNYFEVQRNNGWMLHNTLGASMFEPGTNALNSSGMAHVNWVVTRAPRNRRVVFVLRGSDAKETAQRVEATQIAISRFLPTGDLPPIYLTNHDSPGSSGAYQTAIARAINTSAPAPRLPSSPNGNTAAGAGTP
ncbi:MAG: hypothetical protein AB8B50_19165 [Pirellulaceae bacterium]